VLRPDEWSPHCVITFPTPEQGHNAYRKLREFRKLHELAWDKTNPEWKKTGIKQRIKKIMNQRANMSADLAQVLLIQERHGAEMTKLLEEQQREATEYMDKRWPEIDSLANAAVAKEKVADNVEWLEHQIRSLTMKLSVKHNQNEADQKRLTSAKIIQEIRLRKIKYAQRKAEQFKLVQDELDQKAAPANRPGAEERLQELKNVSVALKEALDNPDPTRPSEDLVLDQQLLSEQQSEIAILEEAFEFKIKADARNHYIARSILPRHLKKTAPTPYTLTGVSVQWADMQDALYAAGKWPETIEHEPLALNKARNDTALLSVNEFEYQSNNEVESILRALEEKRIAAEQKALQAPDLAEVMEPEPEPEPQPTGVAKFLRNPFRRDTVRA
jgi:hypothetical protein